MIKICDCCSNINLERLKTLIPSDKLEIGCLDICESYEDKCFGAIDGEIVYTKTEDEFIDLALWRLSK